MASTLLKTVSTREEDLNNLNRKTGLLRYTSGTGKSEGQREDERLSMQEQDIKGTRAVYFGGKTGNAAELLQRLYLPDLRGGAGYEYDDVQQGNRRSTDEQDRAARGQRGASRPLPDACSQRLSCSGKDE